MVRPEALALAGGDDADFVSPSVAVRALQLHPAGPGVRRDAAVVRRAAPPPLPAADGVRHEASGHALARAHQLLHRLGAAAGSIGDVAGGAQLPAAQLRDTWGEEQDITVTLVASDQYKHFEAPRAGSDVLQVSTRQLRLIPANANFSHLANSPLFI